MACGAILAQNDVIDQNLGERGQKISLKVSKIISVRFMDINLVKNVINGVNLVKIGHFWCENGQNWVILGVKLRHRSKFWESGPIMLSLKVSKNYFSQVYGHKFDQKCH